MGEDVHLCEESPHDMNMIYPHSICTLESRVIHRWGISGHHVEIMTMSSIKLEWENQHSDHKNDLNKSSGTCKLHVCKDL